MIQCNQHNARRYRSAVLTSPKMADGYLRESRLCGFHHNESRVRRAVGPPRQPRGSLPSRGHDGAGLRPNWRDHAFQFRLPGEQKVRPEDGCNIPPVLGAALCAGERFPVKQDQVSCEKSLSHGGHDWARTSHPVRLSQRCPGLLRRFFDGRHWSPFRASRCLARACTLIVVHR